MSDESGRSFGWEDWTWDETLFAGAAPFYERGRDPYSPRLVDAFRDSLSLDGTGRLLDVGCGPGSVALRLAGLFETVVGLDPDEGMLREARRLAEERGIKNATWVCMRAEEMPAQLGEFRVITFAQSFHWMDRPRVARAVHGMLQPDGAVVQVDGPRPGSEASASLPYPPPPDEAIENLRRQWLGEHRRAGQGLRDTSPAGEDDIFQAAGFRPAIEVTVPDDRVLERSVEYIVANRLSTSGMAPHLFGDRLDEFTSQLRSLLQEASPTGRFSVRLSDNRLRIWRPS
jgi:ubiquinone/menaquinone biosynthesis C-methylase UbiE